MPLSVPVHRFCYEGIVMAEHLLEMKNIHDEGEIFIEGQKTKIDDVNLSQNYGIAIIHQELVLVPYLSIAVYIDMFRKRKDRV
jgi:ABC-type sugar transport system ATPase subunit